MKVGCGPHSSPPMARASSPPVMTAACACGIRKAASACEYGLSLVGIQTLKDGSYSIHPQTRYGKSLKTDGAGLPGAVMGAKAVKSACRSKPLAKFRGLRSHLNACRRR